MYRKRYPLVVVTLALLAGAGLMSPAAHAVPLPDGTPFQWGTTTLVHDLPAFTDAGPDARGELPGRYGSQFPRMTELANGSWVVVYTVYDNNGYTYDANGGTRLQIAVSTNDGRSWTTQALVSKAGRDLDNGHIVQRSDGSLVLAYRSVIWGQSYRIETMRSTTGGQSWTALSTVDTNEGVPGSLRNPDRGLYEPFMYFLPDGRLAITYSNEKYALSSPAYAQVISMKVSSTDGASWGAETFPVRDLVNSASRPGMQIITRMSDGRYLLSYELCATDGCNAWFKISNDGLNWDTAMGQPVLFQTGAPYVVSLSDGRLVMTSNTHQISISRDHGATWYLDDTNPFGPLSTDDNLWPAIVQTAPNEIAVITSAGRTPAFSSGHNIKIRFGTFSALSQPAITSGRTYYVTAQHSGKNLDVDAGSGLNGAKVQQWPANGLPPQRWRFDQLLNGTYHLVNQQSGKLLDVDANSLADGARVQQWSDTGCACQDWYLDYVGGGNYRVRASHSNKNLDIVAGSLADGAAAQQWSDNGARPQRWKLTPVP